MGVLSALLISYEYISPAVVDIVSTAVWYHVLMIRYVQHVSQTYLLSKNKGVPCGCRGFATLCQQQQQQQGRSTLKRSSVPERVELTMFPLGKQDKT